jgi:hypothetical protein
LYLNLEDAPHDSQDEEKAQKYQRIAEEVGDEETLPWCEVRLRSARDRAGDDGTLESRHTVHSFVLEITENKNSRRGSFEIKRFNFLPHCQTEACIMSKRSREL